MAWAEAIKFDQYGALIDAALIGLMGYRERESAHRLGVDRDPPATSH
jgi:hypothetical protein